MNMKRRLFLPFLVVFFSLGLFAPAPACADELVLRKLPLHVIEAEQDGKRYWYDYRIPRKEALALLAYFRASVSDPVPLFYAVPGLKGYYVVSSYDEKTTADDYGRRLYLVRKGRGGYEMIDRTPGASDSYILKPVFFLGHGRMLILAEIGTEYSWGLQAYEIRNRRLTYLGLLDATIDSGENVTDPTPFAIVKLVNGRWRVEFSHDLVLDAGGLHDRTIRRKGKKPIVFELKGKEFVPQEGTFLP
jgi:hypothetical protein